MRISTAAFWRNVFLPSLPHIGRAVALTLIGRLRVSAHRRSNSSPIPSASFTMDIELQAIVEPPFMPSRNGCPVQAGWHCRLSWKRRGSRHGGYGRGMPRLRKKMFSKPEATPGAPESSGDRDAGIAMSRMRIKRQRCRGSDKTRWGRVKPCGRCGSRREIGTQIDVGAGDNI